MVIHGIYTVNIERENFGCPVRAFLIPWAVALRFNFMGGQNMDIEFRGDNPVHAQMCHRAASPPERISVVVPFRFNKLKKDPF